MASLTSRLRLRRPDRTDKVSVLADISDNLSRIDTYAPAHACTSTTRPGAGDRYDGMLIFEKDTKKVKIFDVAANTWSDVTYTLPTSVTDATNDSGWVNVSHTNAGWESHPDYPVQTRMIGKKHVQIRGAVRYKSGDLYDQDLCLVGSGHRPAVNTWLGAVKANGGADSVVGSLLALATGPVRIPTSYGSGTLPAGMILPIAGSWLRG